MIYKETDSGNVNSNYLKSSGYRENCQSCVVTYEAKLRGYDVEVLPNTKGSVLEKLSRNTNLAWIDPKTNINPEYIFTTPKKLYKFIDEIVKQNERYTFQWFWKYKWKRGGHIVIIYKNNILTLYDPQSNEIYEGFDMFK